MAQFLLPMARNTVSGETVKQQDLTGTRFTLRQRAMCQEQADRIARKQSELTNEPWQGFVVQYTPSRRISENS